jgi:LuxR family maltose regulon positive regulatory protein
MRPVVRLAGRRCGCGTVVGVTTRAPGRARPTSRQARRSRPELAFEIDESKLDIPQSRPGIVARTAVVDRLLTLRDRAVVTVVAPAGYGKTTVLSQWAAAVGSRVAWVSVDDRDNDPTVLLKYLAVALDRVGPLKSTVLRSLASPGTGLANVVQLTSAIAAMDRPAAVVLDNAETLTNRECRDMVAELAVHLPPGSQLVIGSRQEPPLPVARLRAHGRIVEVGVAELAMDAREARLLLQAAGVRTTDADVEDLVEHTEGWPAGLYLAALAANAGSPQVAIGRTFTGDDRFMGDYLRSEFLDRVSRADVSFLTRTSILERLCGPLCDVTVGAMRSGRVLDRLERGNLLLIPLDRRGEWYRYHHLFRELLHAELLRREPETVTELHSRAASWYELNGLPEAAVVHAQHADDTERVARLVLQLANPVWASGRVDTVLRWMEWLAANSVIEQHPAVAVHGALIHALIGRPGDAERWATAAERTTFAGALPDGNTMEGTLAYLRALFCRDGIDAMRRDAELALEGLAPTSPYRAAMRHAEGTAALLQGDLDTADLFLAQAVDEATSAGVTPFIPLLLAEQGIVAMERARWADGRALAIRALALMDGHDLDDYWTSALVYAWAARVAARQGDVAGARERAMRAARLRPLLTYALPIVSGQALVELARAYLALGDPGGADAALKQVREILRYRPGLGLLSQQVAELRAQLDTVSGEMLGISALTTAELRLLPLLPTHLSLAEIGERLFISRHTVKTHAISVYRKLGVSTRGDAIARLQQLGVTSSS